MKPYIIGKIVQGGSLDQQIGTKAQTNDNIRIYSFCDDDQQYNNNPNNNKD